MEAVTNDQKEIGAQTLSVNHETDNSTSASEQQSKNASPRRYKEPVCLHCGTIGHLSNVCLRKLKAGLEEHCEDKFHNSASASEIHQTQEHTQDRLDTQHSDTIITPLFPTECTDTFEVPLMDDTPTSPETSFDELRPDRILSVPKAHMDSDHSNPSFSSSHAPIPSTTSSFSPTDINLPLSNPLIEVPPLPEKCKDSNKGQNITSISPASSLTSSLKSNAPIKQTTPTSSENKFTPLPKTNHSPATSTRNIITKANTAYADLTLIKKPFKSLEELRCSPKLSPVQAVDDAVQRRVEHPLDDYKIRYGAFSIPVPPRRTLQKKTKSTAPVKSERTGSTDTAHMKSDHSNPSFSSSHAPIPGTNSSFSPTDINPPLSITPISPASLLSSSLKSDAPIKQTTPISSENEFTPIPTTYHSLATSTQNIITMANIAYVDFTLIKKPFKSLEELRCSPKLSPAQTVDDAAQRRVQHPLSVPVPPKPYLQKKTKSTAPVKSERTGSKNTGENEELGDNKCQNTPPLLPPRTYLVSPSQSSSHSSKSSTLHTSLQALDFSSSLLDQQEDDQQELPCQTEAEMMEESATHMYEMPDEVLPLDQAESEPPNQERLADCDMELSPYLKSAGSSSPQDKSPSNIDGASSASSPSRQRKSVIRKGGAKIYSMFSKWNKKLQDNTKKITTTMEHLASVANPMSSLQSRRQRNVIEKYRFAGEMGFGIRLNKPVGPRNEPIHWKSIPVHNAITLS